MAKPETAPRVRIMATAALVVLVCLAGIVPAVAAARDGDGDGMPNRWERAHGLAPFRANARGNPDADGLRNLREFVNGTDPQDADNDDDGIEDGDDDADEDGVADGQEDGDDEDLAGTIASFDAASGLLTIDSTLGTQVTGTVTDVTGLEWSDCEDTVPTAADLVAGTAVDELEFVDGTADLESVELVPAVSCEDDQGEDE